MDWTWSMRGGENDSITGWMRLLLTEMGTIKGVGKVRGW